MAFLLALLGWARAVCAQQLPTQADDQSGAAESLPLPTLPETTVVPTSEEREGLIHLDVASTDERGTTFGDLKSTDLALLEDGTATKVLSFHRANQNDQEERLSEVCMVLDEVDLSPVQFFRVKNEVVDFLRRQLAQPVSILWIKDDGVYTAFPTTNGFMLADNIASNHGFVTVWKFHRLPSGISAREALWNQILRTVYAVAVKWRDKPGRKALIWIGYGWPIRGELDAKGSSFPELVELSTRIREARMVIYDITPWGDPKLPAYDKISVPVNDKIPVVDYHRFLTGVRSPMDPGLKSPAPYFALPVLAVQSGGLVLDAPPNLEGDIGRCIADANAFYTISFDPPPAAQPDEYHDLTVLLGSAQLQARTTYGYYNQPVLYDEPRIAEKQLNVAGLEDLIETDRGEGDRELARTLNRLKLTERLSSGQLEVLKKRLHGKQPQSALMALGDESAFLAPPMSEVPDQPPPDDAMRYQITQRAQKYLDRLVPTLPDFSADATTVKFEQPSPGEKDTWKTAPPNQALLQTIRERTTLLYRNGSEQRAPERVAGKRVAGRNELDTTGIFGPILRFFLDDVRRGNIKLMWARWERTDQGTLAVFRYNAQAEDPRYSVVSCCLVDGSHIKMRPHRNGELTVDPQTGAILRITVESQPGWIRETDLSPLRPVLFSNMMVEYGPVDIGGRSYISPKRSVAITRGRTVRTVSFWGLKFSVYGPNQTLMNDTTYGNYHKFGSESRVLPGFEVEQGGKTPTPEKDDPRSRNQP